MTARKEEAPLHLVFSVTAFRICQADSLAIKEKR